jgi:hypothetical protein
VFVGIRAQPGDGAHFNIRGRVEAGRSDKKAESNAEKGSEIPYSVDLQSIANVPGVRVNFKGSRVRVLVWSDRGTPPALHQRKACAGAGPDVSNTQPVCVPAGRPY